MEQQFENLSLSHRFSSIPKCFGEDIWMPHVVKKNMVDHAIKPVNHVGIYKLLNVFSASFCKLIHIYNGWLDYLCEKIFKLFGRG